MALKLIVGLGNPGATYAGNRHNIGFMVVDALVGPQFAWQNRFGGCYGKAGQIAFLKPNTYMNLSGKAVLACCSYYQILPQEVLVIHDELDLNLGQIRLKQGGGHAGHNGVRSISQHIGGDFYRLRVGIARPAHKSQIVDYVLSDFAPEQIAAKDAAISKIIQDFPQLCTQIS